MLRLLHVISTPSGFGGAERVLASLIREAGDRGWNQLVLNPFAAPDVATRVGPLLGDVTYRAKSVSGAAGLASVRRWLRAESEEFAPSLIHVHLFHAAVAVASMRRTAVPRLLTHHHGDLYAVRGRKGRALLDRMTTNRFDAVVAVSTAVRRLLVEEWGCAQQKVSLIRNGWDGVPLEGPAPGPPTVVCVGNFRPEKGHDVLVQAFAAVRKEVANARLVLVGDGKDRGMIQTEVAKRGLDATVDFVGYTRNVWPHLHAAHVCVLPSRSEALGMAALEAAAAARPVVASDVGGLGEVVDHGVTGYLVPPGDPGPLAQRILELLRDAELRARMGAAARELARNHTARHMVDAYFELYEELAFRN